jgi:hypothetical protein
MNTRIKLFLLWKRLVNEVSQKLFLCKFITIAHVIVYYKYFHYSRNIK